MNNRAIQVEDGRKLGAFIPANLDDYGLAPFEFRIYARIAQRSGSNEASESIANMTAACKMCDQVVKSSLRFLVAAGMLERVSRPGQTTIYRLTPSSRWAHPETLDEIRSQCAHHPNRKISQTGCQGGSDD